MLLILPLVLAGLLQHALTRIVLLRHGLLRSVEQELGPVAHKPDQPLWRYGLIWNMSMTVTLIVLLAMVNAGWPRRIDGWLELVVGGAVLWLLPLLLCLAAYQQLRMEQFLRAQLARLERRAERSEQPADRPAAEPDAV